MKIVKCTNQQELDAALKDYPDTWPELVGGKFEIYGSAQVRAYDSAQVRAYDSAQVGAYDSAQVRAYDSAQVRAYGSAQVRAYGSAQVRAYGSAQVGAYDSAQVRAYDSAQVRAYDSAQVRAYGSAQVRASDSAQVTASGSAQVTAGKHVAVTVLSDYVKADGGVQIRYRPPANVAEWLEEYGVEMCDDNVAILFKAVDSGFKSIHGTIYAPAATPEADGWDRLECSHGLHFCGTPHHALSFNPDAKRFVACPVPVASLLFIPDGAYPTKVKAPRVVAPGCYEVDLHGKRI